MSNSDRPAPSGAGRPLCTVCNERLAKKGRGGKYQAKCDRCYRDPEKYQQRVEYMRGIRKPWSLHKKDSCERCGFVPEHSCQLTVDHIDGDKSNNDPSNYQTLCHNCHALKTYLNKEYLHVAKRNGNQQV